ncbi:hypothetical protein R70006_05012 [Paraburkholderia domus]|uniref:hypothetical protein n=1 Tax=Paraburkholderia domus TaxID=2793075 RepID=UPI00191338DA|nr:hypothetical protein [Paraburkholderia domus]MBK5051752.1 hypothetical protein [Burkholderia sp. R-70006]CAE6794609.1 hypothetical protein R70006_05012 [Paraburkholderia domus]
MKAAAKGAVHFIRHRLPSGEVLLSMPEAAILPVRGRALASQWLNDSDGEMAVAQGAYLPQVGVRLSQAALDVQSAVGQRLGYLVGDMVQTLELLDIEVQQDPECRDRLPFSALVRIAGSALPLLRYGHLTVSAFLRYSNIDAATNILNRPGVFAMKTLGRALSGDDRLNWRDELNRRQVRRLAREIR